MNQTTLETYLNFLKKVLIAIADSDADPQVVYPLLEANLDKLDNNFAETLEYWAKDIFVDSQTDEVYDIAIIILDLVLLLEEFPQGDLANNIEIIICGYQITEKFFRYKTYPEEWALIQHGLGWAYYRRIEGERSSNIEASIKYYQSELNFCTINDFPEEWGKAKNALGLAYLNRIEGNLKQNIEVSIAAFYDALKIYQYDSYPEEWSTIQNNIKTAYFNRIKGNRVKNLEQAIACFQSTFQVLTKQNFPEEWAETYGNIGFAYINQLEGDREKSLELAIEAFQKTLEVYNPNEHPELWALSHNNLGLAYYSCLQNNRSEAVSTALSHYQKALEVCSRDTYPEVWSLAQLNLGVIYLEGIEDDTAEDIETAIEIFQELLNVFNPKETPENWCKTQHNLGFAYYQRIEADRSQNIEQAINHYRLALKVCRHNLFPNIWEMSKNKLGLAYLERIKGDAFNNWQIAFTTFQSVLHFRSRSEFPRQWAEIQNNMGLCCYIRQQGNVLENIEKAIKHYRLAAEVYPRDANPIEWARIQNNLGSVYSDRVKGDLEENADLAINYHQKALEVFTLENFPEAWAEVTYNLANIYNYNSEQDDNRSIHYAIDLYQQLLEFYNREEFPDEWAAIQNNLGHAYSELTEGNEIDNKEKAIFYQQQALEIYTFEDDPESWVWVHNSLGMAYQERIKGDKTENLTIAIQCFQQALEVIDKEADPEIWMITQANLGSVYQELGEIDTAIQYFQSALEIPKLYTSPDDCFNYGENLGNAAFEAERWQEAIVGYEIAIAALEKFRVWTTNEAKRQEILTEDIYLYVNIIQAFISNKQLDKAFEYIERSRCRRLVDLMASNDLYAEGGVSPEVQTYLHQYDSLQQQIDRERLNSKANLDNKQNLVGVGTSIQPSLAKPTRDRAAIEALNAKIATLEAEKQDIWYKIRSLDPVLAGEIQVNSPDLQAIQQLIEQSNTAILSFYTIQKDAYIFVVKKDCIDYHLCPQHEGNNLQDWIEQNWLTSYLEDKERWKQQITSLLAELSQRLKLDNLIAEHLKDIEELIIVPHLYLHQIPFAALPLANDEYLGERFLLRYVPSCQVLEFCHKRPDISSKLTYGIVENATEDLPCANFEGESIAQLYNIPPERRLQGRDRATVNNYRQIIQQVQAIISSHHAQSRLDNPLESKLVLGDGSITLGQLMTPGWRLPHLAEVFLSCCETNLGIGKIVDDIFTISTGFLCAGARSVISTLWAVDDLATALFSIFYHHYRQETLSRPAAIHKAQVKLRTLKGKTLLTEYQSQLIPLLDEKFQQAETKRKQSKAKRDLEAKDSSDYLHWQEKYRQYYQTARHIRAVKKTFQQLCQQDYPFEHPVYWAGFICSGLK